MHHSELMIRKSLLVPVAEIEADTTGMVEVHYSKEHIQSRVWPCGFGDYPQESGEIG